MCAGYCLTDGNTSINALNAANISLSSDYYVENIQNYIDRNKKPSTWTEWCGEYRARYLSCHTFYTCLSFAIFVVVVVVYTVLGGWSRLKCARIIFSRHNVHKTKTESIWKICLLYARKWKIINLLSNAQLHQAGKKHTHGSEWMKYLCDIFYFCIPIRFFTALVFSLAFPFCPFNRRISFFFVCILYMYRWIPSRVTFPLKEKNQVFYL